jgi:hypothetical protein
VATPTIKCCAVDDETGTAGRLGAFARVARRPAVVATARAAAATGTSPVRAIEDAVVDCFPAFAGPAFAGPAFAATRQYSIVRSVIPYFVAAAATPCFSAQANACRFTAASYRRPRCGHGTPVFLQAMTSSISVRSKPTESGWKL